MMTCFLFLILIKLTWTLESILEETLPEQVQIQPAHTRTHRHIDTKFSNQHAFAWHWTVLEDPQRRCNLHSQMFSMNSPLRGGNNAEHLSSNSMHILNATIEGAPVS